MMESGFFNYRKREDVLALADEDFRPLYTAFIEIFKDLSSYVVRDYVTTIIHLEKTQKSIARFNFKMGDAVINSTPKATYIGSSEERDYIALVNAIIQYLCKKNHVWKKLVLIETLLETENESNISALTERLNLCIKMHDIKISFSRGRFYPYESVFVEKDSFFDWPQDSEWSGVRCHLEESYKNIRINNKFSAQEAFAAMESAIKILLNKNGVDMNNSPAAALIDAAMKSDGVRALTTWEGEFIKILFVRVRNNINHGSGNQSSLSIDDFQARFIYDVSEAFIKSIVEKNFR